MAGISPSGNAQTGAGSTPHIGPMFRVLTSKIAYIVYALLVLVLAIIAALIIGQRTHNENESRQAAVSFDGQSIPLDSVIQSGDLQLSTQQNLSINGQLRANNTLILSPTQQPSSQTLGQIYLDSETNKITFFNGQQFSALAEGEELEDLQSQIENTASQAQISALTNQVQALQGQVNQFTLPDNVAQLNTTNTFTQNNRFNGGINSSSLTVTGTTTLGPTTISSLVLNNPLAVASGGTGRTSVPLNQVLIGQGSGPLASVGTGTSGLCLVSTAGAPAFQACPGGGGGGVASLNGLTGAITLANSSAGGSTVTINDATTASKGIAQFDASNFSVSSGTVDTIQDIAVTSTPTFAGLTLNGNFTLGTNSIVTGGGTITSLELDVLDGGINETEVSGVITDVTAGNGLTGGAASGNATLDITSANNAIVVNPNSIALTLQSGSGLEILGGGLSLLQSCADDQILKWDTGTTSWGCATDAGGTGVGDDVLVNSSNANGANFINTAASGTVTSVGWNLNTATDPDEIAISIGNASATQAGSVTTGTQTFAGNKTFNSAVTVEGAFVANGNITLQAGDALTVNGDSFTDLTGAGLTISGGALQSTLGTSIDSSEIVDGTIATIDIADGAINGAKILDGAIATADIGNDQVTGAKIADGTIATIDIGDGQITSVKITDGTIVGDDISNNAVELGTKTTGNYQAGTIAGTGLAVTGSGGEGSTPTISLDYSSTLGSNSLGVNQSSFAATGILFEGATANGYETLLTAVDPTADNTITLPNASGTVCLTSGNCVGVGGGVTSSGGTPNVLAKFDASQNIEDSTITDDGSTVTTSVDLVIQGGNITAGTGSQLGSLVLHDGNGQTTTLQAGNSGSNLTFTLPTSAGSQFQCLKYDTAGQLIWDDCDGGSSGGSGVTALNGLTGSLAIQGNTQIGVSASSPNVNLSINADSIGDAQLAFNTGQNLTTTSTPTFGGLNLNGNLNIGTNSIVTGGATISSVELDVLDGGINENEVTGVITDVTAGNGLSGGAASGNATLNVVSANGGIVVGASDIALTLQPTGNALSATTSSGSGLEVLGGGLTMLQGCSDAQILKWNEASDTWGCAVDAGGTGVGDDILVNGGNADGANFLDTVASGTNASVTWNLNTASSPDEITLSVGNASATEAGVVTATTQTFGGDKTFNNAVTVEGAFTANGNITLQTGDTLTINGDSFNDLTGTGLLISGGALQTTLGDTIEGSEITDGTITGIDIANDTIALGTKTTGNYVAGTTAGTGIAITGSGSEGATPTISLDYSSTLGSNSLGVNQSSFASTGILFEGSIADGFETLLTSANPTADNTITLPNASGTVCLTSGNCVGVGGGVTSSGGTPNVLAKFDASQNIEDSSISDDGSTVSTTGNLVVQGGNITAGTGSQLGSFILHDGSGQTTTLRAGNSGSNLTFVLPTNVGSQYQCLKYDAGGQMIWDDCEGGSSGNSGVTSLNGLTGGVNVQGNTQIGVSASSPNVNLSINADSIGDAQLAFNTGQNLTVSSTPSFAGLGLTGNLNIAGNSIVTSGATISASELNVLDAGISETEVIGVITDVIAGNGLTGGAGAGSAPLNVASANAGIVANADNIALALQPSTDALSSTTSSGSGLEITSGGLSMLQGCANDQILKWNETSDTWGCSTDATGATPTLQAVYDASSPAQILLSNAKDFVVNAQDTATDPSIVFNLSCATCSANGGRFAIQDAGVDIFRVNPNGDIIIGTATNNMTFAAADNYQSTLSGNARRAKTITLSPEYSGVVLDAAQDAACSSADAGTMTSGYTATGAGGLPENYYQWSTTGTAQCYNVVVQVKIPDDFDSWTGTQSVDTWTNDTANGTVLLDIRNTTGGQDGSAYGNNVTPTSNNAWQSRPFTFASSYDSSSAGDFITLRIRTTASSGDIVRLGSLQLNYLSRY